MALHFSISGFTHTGTVRTHNEDHILVNGTVLNSGTLSYQNQNGCACFVADGVGGNKAGEFASHYVLDKIKGLTVQQHTDLADMLPTINEALLHETQKEHARTGAATTLSGLMADSDSLHVFHAGDSEIWLLRDSMFFKITKDHVFDPDAENSPITSYFGGLQPSLVVDSDVPIKEAQPDDFFLICSDGLFKSLSAKEVKSILLSDADLGTKAETILSRCLHSGAEDNTSAIFIQVTL